MDRLFIPNYSAILPGTEDTIWVYSGKGLTKAHAKAGALMEAIERYSSLSSTHRRYLFKELIHSYRNLTIKFCILHEVMEPVNQNILTKNLLWISCQDLTY